MADYLEDQFGAVVGAGTDYVIVGTDVPAATKWNTLMSFVNVHSDTILVRAYIADADWVDHTTSGEPNSTELVVRLLYDKPLAKGAVLDLSGRILLTDQKLVVRSNVAASLDVLLSGVAITAF